MTSHLDTRVLEGDLAAEIIDEVDRGFEDQIAFTRELIRIPTVRGRERDGQDLIFDYLATHGYEMDRFLLDPVAIRAHPASSPIEVSYEDAVNVVGTMRPERETGRSLILNGHVDVVPPGATERWSHGPFEPVIEGDWLCGRGAGDMKAGSVANLFAVDALRRLGLRPTASLYQESVVEEETTGNGTLACLLRGYRADASLIPEPEDDKLVRAAVGVLWFRIRIEGQAGHLRNAPVEANTIESMYPLVQGLRELEARWNAESHRHPYFEDIADPIHFNPGLIRGGDWTSSAPPWCELDCRISFYPEIEPATAAAEIERCVADVAYRNAIISPTITWTGFFANGYVLEEGTEAEQVLARAHQRCHGTELQAFTTLGYLDGQVFVRHADTPCLVYGPTTKAIHGFDERVSIESVRRITKSIALFVAAWCGLEAI